MPEMPAVHLSSRFTFFYKFVFPTVWLAGFLSGTIVLWLDSRPDAHAMAIPFTVATIIGAIVFLKFCVPLKRVIAGDDGLSIDNFLRKIHVPYSQITDVEQSKWINTSITTVSLATDTPFGQKVAFMPYARFTLAVWRDHPAVTLLRERVVVAKRPG
jgi:hypothetical protein